MMVHRGTGFRLEEYVPGGGHRLSVIQFSLTSLAFVFPDHSFSKRRATGRVAGGGAGLKGVVGDEVAWLAGGWRDNQVERCDESCVEGVGR